MPTAMVFKILYGKTAKTIHKTHLTGEIAKITLQYVCKGNKR